MKNEYKTPEIEIILINEDIITASKMFGGDQPGDDPYSFENFNI